METRKNVRPLSAPRKTPDPGPQSAVQSEDPKSLAESSESFAPATTGDAATSEDQLGFNPYARGLSEFLLNRDTKGPLTVSIEGEWGSGKSSFMLILEGFLTRGSLAKTAAGITHNIPLIAKFNPWRHDKDEALWATFAINLTKQIVKEQKFVNRLNGHIRLLRSRFDWSRGWLELLKAGAAFLILTGLVLSLLALTAENGPGWLLSFAKTVSISDKDKEGSGEAIKLPTTQASSAHAEAKPTQPSPPKEFSWFIWLSGFGFFGVIAAYIIAVFVIVSKVKVFFSAPLASDLSKHFRSPNYTSKASFIEEFHEDFRRIVEAYSNGKTIFVFVDDLDRCAVPRAADLMQAINLMISTELRDIIFILGMDREKIAAGLAMKNADLLPYLNLDIAKTSDAKALSPRVGLQFGFQYLEKFVQISFPLPKPRIADIDRFLKSLSGTKAAPPPDAKARRDDGEHATALLGKAVAGSEVPGAKEAQSEAAIQQFQIQFSTDSDSILRIVREVSPFLDDNPRRLKQFINIFRLRAFVAYETGALENGKMTPQQLGKLIAIQMRWPVLAAKYLSDLRLWSSLQSRDFNIDGVDSQRLRELLNLVPNGSDNRAWTMDGFDIEAFARVSPSIRTVDLNAPSENVRSKPPMPPSTDGRRDESRVESPDQPTSCRILWVDDEPANTEALREKLESRFVVSFTLCTSTQTGLASATSTEFNLIISDMGRPGDKEAGYTLLNALRAQNIQTPFLIFSATTSSERRAEAKKRGAIDFTSRDHEVVGVVASYAEERRDDDSYPSSTFASA